MRKIKKAYIEITNSCNLSCDFCPGTSRPKAFMSPSEFELVLERLQERVQCLYFHLMGEPLLHPSLSRFLDMAHEAGFPVNLTTNGTLLGTAGMGIIGKPALRQVHVSMHSQAGSGNLGDYLDSVLRFAREIRKSGNTLVAFRLWNIRNNEANREAEDIEKKLALEYGLESVPAAGGDERGVRLADGVYLNRSAPFEWPGMGLEPVGENGFCMGLRDQIGVLCDGTVVPCCLDGEGAIALGNLFAQPLDEILASPRAHAIYDGFSRRRVVEELCRRCGYRRRFD